jgi:hypothetical protein
MELMNGMPESFLFSDCCEDCKAERVQREAEMAAKVEAKARGIAKLMALGLTEEEAGALIG